MAVDKIKLSSVLERLGDEGIRLLWVDGGILFISLVHHSMQVSPGHGIRLVNNVTSQPRATEPFSDV